jgi:hypothetical protein
MTPVGAHPFAKLIPGYLRNCRMNIIAMRDAPDRADFETVRSLGHQMVGTGRGNTATGWRSGAQERQCDQVERLIPCNLFFQTRHRLRQFG